MQPNVMILKQPILCCLCFSLLPYSVYGLIFVNRGLANWKTTEMKPITALKLLKD